MRYNYCCDKCSGDGEDRFIFEVEHGMKEDPKIKCPKCNGKTHKTLPNRITFYTRGYGYLDKPGARRDMNVHKLVHDDPYKKMREPGEKDDLLYKLRTGGKHKKNPKHFLTSSNKKKKKK